MEKVLEKAIKKAKAYGLPMVVYKDNKINNLDYCSLDVFGSKSTKTHMKMDLLKNVTQQTHSKIHKAVTMLQRYSEK